MYTLNWQCILQETTYVCLFPFEFYFTFDKDMMKVTFKKLIWDTGHYSLDSSSGICSSDPREKERNRLFSGDPPTMLIYLKLVLCAFDS